MISSHLGNDIRTQNKKCVVTNCNQSHVSTTERTLMQWVLHSFCYWPWAIHITDAAQGQALPDVVAGTVGGSNQRLALTTS